MVQQSAVEMQLKALTTSWISQVKRAEKEKSAFNAIAHQCKSFAGGKSQSNFMWQPQYRDKYIGKGIKSPKFEVSLLKGFEYIAIFGPMLYWDYPTRKVQPTKSLVIDPAVVLGNDEQNQMFGESLVQQQAMEDQRAATRARLYEDILNYIQREQPGGGLATHSKLAINEALLKGRGLVWTESYQYPGSGRKLVGSFFDTVNNLFIDPDCCDPTLTKAKWIARRRYTPYWEVEKKFNLPKNYLRDKGKYESGASQANASAEKKEKQSPKNDLVEWYEVYSRCGVGVKIDGVRSSMDEAWDEVVGDYAYIAVCEHCDFPLNAPLYVMSDENLGDDQVEQFFSWPIPFWADDKWPVSQLDFYPDETTCWPVPPLAPALGELTCLNILISCYVEQAYETRQQIVAYVASAASEVEAALKSAESTIYLKLNDSIQRSVNEVVQFLNRADPNNGLLEAIQFLLQRFEERTGLSEILYGNAGPAVDRSAEAARNRNDRASVRPDYMAKVVADWQSAIADKEKIALRFTVTAQDLAPQLGSLGSYAWQTLVEQEDPEVVLRGMKCLCYASDMRKPDKARETSNMQQLTNQVLPVIAQISATTGDYKPLNEFFKSIGDSMEQDVNGWLIPEESIDPAMQELSTQQQQADLEKTQAEADSKRADAEAKRASIGKDEHQLEIEHAKGQQKMQMEAAAAQQKMALEQQKTALQLNHANLQHKQKANNAAGEFFQRQAMRRAEFAANQEMRKQQQT